MWTLTADDHHSRAARILKDLKLKLRVLKIAQNNNKNHPAFSSGPTGILFVYFLFSMPSFFWWLSARHSLIKHSAMRFSVLTKILISFSVEVRLGFDDLCLVSRMFRTFLDDGARWHQKGRILCVFRSNYNRVFNYTLFVCERWNVEVMRRAPTLTQQSCFVCCCVSISRDKNRKRKVGSSISSTWCEKENKHTESRLSHAVVKQLEDVQILPNVSQICFRLSAQAEVMCETFSRDKSWLWEHLLMIIAGIRMQKLFALTITSQNDGRVKYQAWTQLKTEQTRIKSMLISTGNNIINYAN